MNLKTISDDFFSIGEIAILYRNSNNGSYDFSFRHYFDCHSVVSAVNQPVLLHIGAIEDYKAVSDTLNEMGMKLLVPEKQHIRCSTIEGWYPALKEKTPFTRVYETLPPLEKLLRDFSFPVFIKGNRQTNRHKRSHCIVENAKAYEAVRTLWHSDPVLSWQKAAVREFVPLQTVDADSFPDMIPISYEFRFFYFEGKCMGYGPYWNDFCSYSISPEELQKVLQLTDWAANRLAVSFPAIDVAKTANGDWIVIEVNDAQESGFAGIDPLKLWNNAIDAMQNRNWIPVEELFEEGAVIMLGDPFPNKSLEEMWIIAKNYRSTQELVDAYAGVNNKFWWIEDDLYDFEVGTEDYKAVRVIVDAWSELMNYLQRRVILCAEEEELFDKQERILGLHKQLQRFMKKYGYSDGQGWWIKDHDE